MATVAVLRGGVGVEHDVSLKTGLTVLRKLEHTKYHPTDVYIDRSGVWHMRGVATTPQRALATSDVVFNALHGAYGEDGGVQRELDRIGVPYTGPRAIAASMSMNKALTKEMVSPKGVLVPRHVLVGVVPNLEARAINIWQTFSQPSIVKPLNAGSSIGVSLVQSYQELIAAIKTAFQYSKDVVVEEYIRGQEATVGVIDDFRGSKTYVLPPVEILLPKTCPVFDFKAKYGGEVGSRCPGAFSRAQIEQLEAAARTVHDTLGMRHYSRSDFIVTPKGLYFLEVNGLPDLAPESSMHTSLDAVGSSMDDLLTHVLSMALEKK
jgi:D-alanine-D-alanine ligase